MAENTRDQNQNERVSASSTDPESMASDAEGVWSPDIEQSFQEALEAGELYEFKSRRKAERFAAGSWKKGKAKREAMKAYRAKKKENRKNNK